MRFLALFALLFLAPVAGAQGEPETKYTNEELGIEFVGVYGWETERPEGSGAWTMLVSYRNAAFGAEVKLLVRPNPFADTHELRKALQKEFAAGGEPSPGKPVFKDVTFRDVEMKRGNKLPGIDVEAVRVSIDEEGKKREHQVLVGTYFGANRLFQVYCEAPRARARRVRDLFDRALAGLTVTAADEKVKTSIPFRSERGRYACMVPETFAVVLPGARRTADVEFVSKTLGVRIAVYSHPFRGDLRDHADELADYYGSDLKIDNESARHFGGEAFDATLTRAGKSVTLITGTIRDGRLYRVHTSTAPDKLEEAKRVHAKFLEEFRIGG